MMTGKRTNNLAHLIVLVCVTFAAGTIVRSAFAQAGSAGGSVGQQDKSVSGSEDQESAQKKSPRPTPKHSPVKSTSTASRCSIFAGSYSYPFKTVTVFKSDGTASNSSGLKASWTCANGTVTVKWNTGYVDTLIPSGGSSFSATNDHGWVWSATRM
jgi:hypothetical protein